MTTFCNKKVLFCSIYWPDPHPHTHPTLHEQEIPVEMVLTSIKQLDINKATGSDEIPMRLLKETANQIAPSLTMLFNKSLRLGIFSRRMETREYSTHFQERKKETLWKIIALSSFSLSSPKFSSAAFWRVNEPHIPPLQPRTAWLLSQ